MHNKHNLDKISALSSHTALAVSGNNCDRVAFTEYVSKNVALYELMQERLSPHAQAHFCRGELAKALRRGPFQVNLLLAGYDTKTNTPALYILDYLGSLHQVPHGCQGYAGYFCLSVMDRATKPNLSKDDALAIIAQCMQELKTRFLVAQPNFVIKNIDKEGVTVVSVGTDPDDN